MNVELWKYGKQQTILFDEQKTVTDETCLEWDTEF